MVRLPRHSLPSNTTGLGSNVSLRILIGVFSRAAIGRSFVRQSWGSQLHPSVERLWFIVALPSDTNHTQAAHRTVRAEAATHGDMLLLHGHREAYGSLPHKVLAFYAAATASSLRVRHLLKTDDDVWLSMATVRCILPLLPLTGAYAGYVYRGIQPERRRTSKYSDDIFSQRHAIPSTSSPSEREDGQLAYPPYVDGIGELLSADVAACIVARLHAYDLPSTLADVVTGHAARQLCSVAPCAGHRGGGCLPLPSARERLAWPALPDGEQAIFVRHTDRTVVTEQYRSRLRFRMLMN